ncbi:MAG: hypothetical protein WCO88_00165 [Actinomycetota bacterium]
MRTQTTDRSDTMKFRGPTLEDAVALAEQSLGSRVKVIAAHRIRRGGIGGFFAADLGIEVEVTLESETIEDALERLINSSGTDERAQWEADRDEARARLGLDDAAVDTSQLTSQRMAMSGAASRTESRAQLRQEPASWYEPPSDYDLVGSPNMAIDAYVPIEQRESVEVRRQQLTDELRRSVQPATFERVDRATAHTVGSRASATPIVDVEPAQPAVEASPSLLRVESIIEELQALTASPRVLSTIKQRRADADAEAARMSEAVTDTTELAITELATTELATGDTATSEPGTASLPAVGSRIMTFSQTPATEAAARTVELIDTIVSPTATETSALAQRQVELAVAATDQLIESLTREDGVRRVSVRVVLRTADQQEVEAEAEWEAQA